MRDVIVGTRGGVQWLWNVDCCHDAFTFKNIL
jgi:hypothetical protein